MKALSSWAIIYCPKEGNAHSQRRWKKIRNYLQEQGVAFDFVQSEGQGSVERLASMMNRSGYGTIVIVGGDSALNHALCGIMSSENPTGKWPTLGVIPNGVGNDFAKYWGLSYENYKASVDALIRHNVRKVDVGVADVTNRDGMVERLHFLNCINFGVASSITELRKKTRRLFGFRTISYAFSALLLLFKRLNFKFVFDMSGEHVEQSAMSVCVGSAHGYGQTPSAVPYNGLLDVTLVSKPAAFQIFQGLWLLFTSRFLSHRGVRVWRTNHISFRKLSQAKLSLDGRVYRKSISQVDIRILPEEIEFLIP